MNNYNKTNYQIWAWVCIVIGMFFAGIIMFPVAWGLSQTAINHGENAGLAKAVSIIGTIFMAVVFLLL